MCMGVCGGGVGFTYPNLIVSTASTHDNCAQLHNLWIILKKKRTDDEASESQTHLSVSTILSNLGIK